MVNNEFFNPLTNEELVEIIHKVNICSGKYKKTNRIIREDIFKILEMNSKIIYYPIEDDDICGFVYKFKGYKFCYINSNIPLEKQVFAAAHELYHILYSDIGKGELINSQVIDGKLAVGEINREDIKANRFAAEFLVPEEVFRNELNIRGIIKNSIDLSGIVELMDVFLVPFKTLITRLFEIEYISKEKFKEFMFEESRNEDQGIMLLQKRLGLCKRNNDRTKEIKLDKLVDTALKLYEKNEITYEKLEYLLSLSKFKPSDFNIYEEECYIAPENEILKIMEE